MIPDRGDLTKVQVEVPRLVQDLVSFGVRLEHSVLDAVMHHLHVVSCPGRADVRVSIGRRQRNEGRFTTRDSLRRSADHEAIAILEPPYSSARPGIDQLHAALAKLGGPANRVVKSRVAAVDDDVAGGKVRYQPGDRIVYRIPGRHHDPDDPRCGEAGTQIGQIAGALRT